MHRLITRGSRSQQSTPSSSRLASPEKVTDETTKLTKEQEKKVHTIINDFNGK